MALTTLLYTVRIKTDNPAKAGKLLGEKLHGPWAPNIALEGCWLAGTETEDVNPALYPPNVKCACGDLIHPDQPVTVAAWNRLLDDQVEAWHQSPLSDPTPLHEYLGMTWNEYSAWTENESAIPARWLT